MQFARREFHGSRTEEGDAFPPAGVRTMIAQLAQILGLLECAVFGVDLIRQLLR